MSHALAIFENAVCSRPIRPSCQVARRKVGGCLSTGRCKTAKLHASRGRAGAAASQPADVSGRGQYEDIEQAVQSQMTPNQNPETSQNLTYEELLGGRHSSAGTAADASHTPGSQAAASAVNASPQSEKTDAAPQQLPAPARSVFDRLRSQGGLWQQAIVLLPVALAGLAGLLLAWQLLRFVISCILSLAHIHTWLIITGLIVITLITPQGTKVNGLLRFVDDCNIFANYGEAKHAVGVATWSSIAVFLVLVFCAGLL